METQQIAKEITKPYLHLSDYELRTKLIGCAFLVAKLAGQHYEPGTPEYISLYGDIYETLTSLSKKANKGTRKFKVNTEYKSKTSSEIFGYECTKEERTEEEVKQRLKEKTWYNLRSNRVIKPVFTRIEITAL